MKMTINKKRLAEIALQDFCERTKRTGEGYEASDFTISWERGDDGQESVVFELLPAAVRHRRRDEDKKLDSTAED